MQNECMNRIINESEYYKIYRRTNYFMNEQYIIDLKMFYGNIFTENFILNNLKNCNLKWNFLFEREEFKKFLNEIFLIKLIINNINFFYLKIFIEKKILNISFIEKYIELLDLKILSNTCCSMDIDMYNLLYKIKQKIYNKSDLFFFKKIIYNSISRSEKLKWDFIIYNLDYEWDWYNIIYLNKNVMIPPIILNYLNGKYIQNKFYKLYPHEQRKIMTIIIEKWLNKTLYVFNRYSINVY